MFPRNVIVSVLTGAMTVGLSWVSAALAQETYPSRLVTIVVPFAAGSGPDIFTRQLAEQLSVRLRKPFIVENRGGANGIPAIRYVARSASDGYTLLLGTSTTLAGNPHLFRNLGYDPTHLTSISIISSAPMVLAVAPNSGKQSLQDLIQAAKKNQGQLSYASPNAGSQAVTERLKLRAGIDLLRVPYRATGEAITDLMGGRIDVLFADMPIVLSVVKNNQLRALAVSGSARTSLLPDVPTMQELGFSDLVLTLWLGLFAPDQLAPNIRDTLDRAVASSIADPSMRDRMATVGMEITYLNAGEATDFVKSELQRWGEFVEGAGIKPQD